MNKHQTAVAAGAFAAGAFAQAGYSVFVQSRRSGTPCLTLRFQEPSGTGCLTYGCGAHTPSGTFPGQPARAEGRLKIVAANGTVQVEQLARKKEPRHQLALHACAGPPRRAPLRPPSPRPCETPSCRRWGYRIAWPRGPAPGIPACSVPRRGGRASDRLLGDRFRPTAAAIARPGCRPPAAFRPCDTAPAGRPPTPPGSPPAGNRSAAARNWAARGR